MSKKIVEANRALLADETGRRYPAAGPNRTLVVYPNTYRVAMSNLAFQWLYHELNTRPGFAAERVVLPDPALLDEYQRTGARLLTLEQAWPASQCGIWFVTCSFENDYPNLLTLLDLAGIPLRAADRNHSSPLIVLGGPAVMLNPEPMAEFADVILLGDGEATLPPFLDLYESALPSFDRNDFLERVAAMPFAYAPRFYNPQTHPRRVIARAASIDQSATATHLFTPHTEFSDTYLLETFRGCRSRCRFCAAGHLFLPPRERTLDESTFTEIDAPTVGLVGAGISQHSQIDGWINAAGNRRVGLSSLRLGALNSDGLAALVAGGATTVAIAPEAGTDRLRAVCNKGFSNEEVIDETKRLIGAGLQNLKLYFMVGLPTESADDVAGIAALTIAVRDAAMTIWKQRGRAGTINASVNPFVPKAFTPFQWAPFITKTDYNRIRKNLQRTLGREPNIDLKFESYRGAQLQAILSLADRRASELLLAIHREGNLPRALAQWSVDAKTLLHELRPADFVFPWHFIDAGMSDGYLMREYDKAMRGKTSAPCMDGCNRCGICSA